MKSIKWLVMVFWIFALAGTVIFYTCAEFDTVRVSRSYFCDWEFRRAYEVL